MRYLLWICICLLGVIFPPAAAAQAEEHGSALYNKKIVLIPLDSRPVNTSYLTLLGRMAGANVIWPQNGLDRWEKPADYGMLKQFLGEHIASADAVFIAVPGWLNGGLLHGRYTSTYTEHASRLTELKALLLPYKDKSIYLIGVIPREKPATGTPAAAHSFELTQFGRRYAQYIQSDKPENRRYHMHFLRKLQQATPPEHLLNYTRLFQENMQVLYTMAGWARDGIVDGVLIGTDDTSTLSLPKLNELRIREYCKRERLSNVHIMTGADDLTALLLARYKNEQHGTPSHYTIAYSHHDDRQEALTYDGVPLAEMIAVKTRFLQPSHPWHPKQQLALYIHSDEEGTEQAAEWSKQNSGTIRGLADVSYPEFPDTGFMEAYTRQKLSGHFESYASWNTGGNTIGLLLAHMEMIRSEPVWNEAHEEWMALRYAEDYYYNSVKRPEYARRYSPLRMLEVQEEADAMAHVQAGANRLLSSLSYVTRTESGMKQAPICFRVEKASLPWKRIFEISYTMQRDEQK